jgi:predicted AAA+ superfamily ATPase
MLSDETLLQILAEWSFWDSLPPKKLAKRQINLPNQLHDDLALIIQGVRRGGKSTLLMQIPERYDLPLSHCVYCNFEDPRLLDDLNHTLLSRIIALARKRISQNEPCYFFFDEIQNVQEWEKWLHTQLERPKNNFYTLTGSNSRLLSGEFATSLTGRHITLELYPFSFSEYQKFLPKSTLKDYLNTGGFPRPLTFEQPFQLLQEYFQDIILRDVLKRVHARTSEAIKQVAKMTFDSCGSELSYRKIAAVTGLTVDTVQLYLQACEDAYLLFACQFFAFSEQKRMARQKKYYAIDSGLRNAVASISGRDYGKNLELMVYIRLRQINEQVYYWQELHKGEVDFVTVNGNNITPYQISLNGREARHEKALDNFYIAFPQANEAIFITSENAEEYL